MAVKSRSKIKHLILEEAVRAMLPYVGGWIETLGKVGAPPGRYTRDFEDVGTSARVMAARDGIGFLVKYLQNVDDDSAGQELLAALQKAGAFTLNEYQSGESADRDSYAGVGFQGVNLASGGGSVRRD